MKNLLKTKTIVKIIICVIWVSVILYNGTRQGETSQRSSKEIVKLATMVMNIPTDAIDGPSIKFSDVNYFVRKNAHFFQYFILSILICTTIKEFNLNKWSEIFLLLFILLLFPVIDEFIQKYIPGRTSNIFDVVIDFSGGILGLTVSNLWYKMHEKKVEVRLY
ncbi:VanZ family protein [Clostridium sp.]|uniref:VanZ family protein n=1 Tax=Clostridium sp. TaxID=1506 RepID=UPI001A4F6370|nr:VanZ family protein [Clostridium sp.]MBK5237065.1 VanZ family protein [Clostridium sp.]